MGQLFYVRERRRRLALTAPFVGAWRWTRRRIGEGRREAGVVLVEYVLLLGIVVVASIAPLKYLANSVDHYLTAQSTRIDRQTQVIEAEIAILDAKLAALQAQQANTPPASVAVGK